VISLPLQHSDWTEHNTPQTSNRQPPNPIGIALAAPGGGGGGRAELESRLWVHSGDIRATALLLLLPLLLLLQQGTEGAQGRASPHCSGGGGG
jgi:hypothetical protein